MAQLTYDPTPADQPEFNEAEQEALEVGEKALAEQEQMLAGKFKDAEELEKAYIELQKKLGTNEESEETEEVRDDETSPEEVEEPSESETLIGEASAEYYEKGELSPETLEKLQGMSSEDLINTYMKMQGDAPAPEPVADLSDKQVENIKGLAGGEEQYGQLVGWAAENLPEETVKGFDTLIESGNEQAIRLAVRGLMAEYENQNGFEGQMLSGKSAPFP